MVHILLRNSWAWTSTKIEWLLMVTPNLKNNFLSYQQNMLNFPYNTMVRIPWSEQLSKFNGNFLVLRYISGKIFFQSIVFNVKLLIKCRVKHALLGRGNKACNNVGIMTCGLFLIYWTLHVMATFWILMNSTRQVKTWCAPVSGSEVAGQASFVTVAVNQAEC